MRLWSNFFQLSINSVIAEAILTRGKRRNLDGTDNPNCSPNPPSATLRGFTGQETMDMGSSVSDGVVSLDPVVPIH
jgi:hypothetical protein